MSLPWGLVLSFALTGVFMSLLSCLRGLRQKAEIPLWWALYAIWVVIVVWRDVPNPFLVILVASILAGVLNGALTSILIEHYIRNNPWYADKMQGSKLVLSARFLMMGVVIGVVFGALVGAIAWALSRWI